MLCRHVLSVRAAHSAFNVMPTDMGCGLDSRAQTGKEAGAVAIHRKAEQGMTAKYFIQIDPSIKTEKQI